MTSSLQWLQTSEAQTIGSRIYGPPHKNHDEATVDMQKLAMILNCNLSTDLKPAPLVLFYRYVALMGERGGTMLRLDRIGTGKRIRLGTLVPNTGQQAVLVKGVRYPEVEVEIPKGSLDGEMPGEVFLTRCIDICFDAVCLFCLSEVMCFPTSMELSDFVSSTIRLPSLLGRTTTLGSKQAEVIPVLCCEVMRTLQLSEMRSELKDPSDDEVKRAVFSQAARSFSVADQTSTSVAEKRKRRDTKQNRLHRHTVFVTNIDRAISDAELQGSVARYLRDASKGLESSGNNELGHEGIWKVRIARTPQGESKGFGFVYLRNSQACDRLVGARLVVGSRQAIFERAASQEQDCDSPTRGNESTEEVGMKSHVVAKANSSFKLPSDVEETILSRLRSKQADSLPLQQLGLDELDFKVYGFRSLAQAVSSVPGVAVFKMQDAMSGGKDRLFVGLIGT